jgi:hypothetical protein
MFAQTGCEIRLSLLSATASRLSIIDSLAVSILVGGESVNTLAKIIILLLSAPSSDINGCSIF